MTSMEEPAVHDSLLKICCCSPDSPNKFKLNFEAPQQPSQACSTLALPQTCKSPQTVPLN